MANVRDALIEELKQNKLERMQAKVLADARAEALREGFDTGWISAMEASATAFNKAKAAIPANVAFTSDEVVALMGDLAQKFTGEADRIKSEGRLE